MAEEKIGLKKQKKKREKGSWPEWERKPSPPPEDEPKIRQINPPPPGVPNLISPYSLEDGVWYEPYHVQTLFESVWGVGFRGRLGGVVCGWVFE